MAGLKLNKVQIEILMRVSGFLAEVRWGLFNEVFFVPGTSVFLDEFKATTSQTVMNTNIIESAHTVEVPGTKLSRLSVKSGGAFFSSPMYKCLGHFLVSQKLRPDFVLELRIGENKWSITIHWYATFDWEAYEQQTVADSLAELEAAMDASMADFKQRLAQAAGEFLAEDRVSLRE